jgi:hypothetical protein
LGLYFTLFFFFVEVSRDGPIPIHMLKSLNGDSWSMLYEHTRPFADDSTSAMTMMMTPGPSAGGHGFHLFVYGTC